MNIIPLAESKPPEDDRMHRLYLKPGRQSQQHPPPPRDRKASRPGSGNDEACFVKKNEASRPQYRPQGQRPRYENDGRWKEHNNDEESFVTPPLPEREPYSRNGKPNTVDRGYPSPKPSWGGYSWRRWLPVSHRMNQAPRWTPPPRRPGVDPRRPGRGVGFHRPGRGMDYRHAGQGTNYYRPGRSMGYQRSGRGIDYRPPGRGINYRHSDPFLGRPGRGGRGAAGCNLRPTGPLKPHPVPQPIKTSSRHPVPLPKLKKPSMWQEPGVPSFIFLVPCDDSVVSDVTDLPSNDVGYLPCSVVTVLQHLRIAGEKEDEDTEDDSCSALTESAATGSQEDASSYNECAGSDYSPVTVGGEDYF